MNGLHLITGVPGVGKSTACRLLVERYPEQYVHISFGSLISTALNSSGGGVEERQLRQDVTKLVTPAVLSDAIDLLVMRLGARDIEGKRALLDSHAVSPDWYGFIATLDGQKYFSRIRYRSIVHLFASAQAVLLRSELSSSGRRSNTLDDISMSMRLMEAVSINYSGMSECPAFFICADGDAAHTADKINSVLTGP